MTCVNLSERKAAKGDHLPSSWGGQGVMIATEMNTWLLISFVHVCFVHMLYACLHVCEHPWVGCLYTYVCMHVESGSHQLFFYPFQQGRISK